jgi:hypothetical protein
MLRRKGLGLVDRDLVAVAVDDLPLAVLAAVDLGDAQGVRLDGDAVDRHRGVLELDRVGQVAADPRPGSIVSVGSNQGMLRTAGSR